MKLKMAKALGWVLAYFYVYIIYISLEPHCIVGEEEVLIVLHVIFIAMAIIAAALIIFNKKFRSSIMLKVLLPYMFSLVSLSTVMVFGTLSAIT